jgi:hypothetical protein
LSKDRQVRKAIKIWQEDFSDIVKEDSSFQVRLLVEFQGEIPAETNSLLFEVLLNNWGIF